MPEPAAACVSSPSPGPGQLLFDAAASSGRVNQEPFAFAHDLHELDLFRSGSLRMLALRMSRTAEDFFVAHGAPAAGSAFYEVNHGGYLPHVALEHLEARSLRVILKRPERHDPRFAVLMARLFEQVLELNPALRRDPLVRLESAVFISSAATTTPFHYDPEISFFTQIEGEKRYHVFSPTAVREAELEGFFARGARNVGQLDLAQRDPALEYLYALKPGLGFHQPHHAPHWVETGAGRSISYSIVFETASTRLQDRVRSFNHYLRRLGLKPAPLALHPGMDAIKSGAMRLVLPTRRRLGRAFGRVLGLEDPSAYDA